MNISPEMKAQLEAQKAQCIFCKIIKGEIPGKKIFEDNVTIAYADIYPAKKGHTLFLLKEHYPIMPYIPPEEFKHYFGLIPQICKAVKSAMVATSVNVFIAGGGAAGQQAPHFLAHIFPRDSGDGFFNFLFKRKETLEEDKIKMLAHNFPLMMQNHFSRNPASWHQDKGQRPNFLKEISETSAIIYEDEKTLAVIPKKGVVKGHIEIYSKEEEREIEKLSIESATHLFYVASFAATAVFEGLGAQGTNIILKSGYADDNEEGRLCIHVLSRTMEDGLNNNLLWQPKPPSYDVDEVMKKIQDKSWNIKYVEAQKEEKIEVKSSPVAKVEEKKKKVIETFSKAKSAEEEIRMAIEKIKK